MTGCVTVAAWSHPVLSLCFVIFHLQYLIQDEHSCLIDVYLLLTPTFGIHLTNLHLWIYFLLVLVARTTLCKLLQQVFCRGDNLPVDIPATSKHWRNKIKIWANLFDTKCIKWRRFCLQLLWVSHFKFQILLYSDVIVCLQGMALSMGDKINLSQKKNKMEAVMK